MTTTSNNNVRENIVALVNIMPFTRHERGSVPAVGLRKVGQIYLSRAIRNGLLTKEEAHSSEYRDYLVSMIRQYGFPA